MSKSLTFNGIKKPWLYLLEGRQKSPFASVKNNLLYVPGMAGAHVTSKEIQPIYISQPIGFIVKDDEHALQLIDELTSWLNTNEAVPLQFDDEPGRTYYAEIEGTIDDFSRFVRQRRGVITFLCADPFAYSQENTEPIDDTPILVNGTAPTGPIFSVTLKEPTTFVAVSNGEKMNLVGNPLSEHDTPKERFTRRYWSEADKLIGWTVPGATEGGAVAGEMDTDGFRFYAKSYGTGPLWHGPARKVALPEILTDFRVDALIELDNKSTNWGKIIVSGLDQANNVVFSMSMGDAYSTPRALGIVRAGNEGAGHNIINHIGTPPAWNNFEGLLRIIRNKNTWVAYITRFNLRTGKYDTGMYETWPDKNNSYTRELAQIQVQIVSHGSRPVAVARLQDVKVFRVNDMGPDEIEYVGVKDDVIEFDHINDVIYRNDEIITKEKAFIGDYFQLNPGANHLVAEPSEAIDIAEVRWRDRWR